MDTSWAAERIQGGLSTGEGLIWGVHDPIEKQEPIRDYKQITGYQTLLVDAGVSDKRRLVVESELASRLRVMGREGSTLSPLIRQAWDTGELRTYQEFAVKATEAHISIIAHVTRDELLRFLTQLRLQMALRIAFYGYALSGANFCPQGDRFRM